MIATSARKTPHVLVVEDDREISQALGTALASNGMRASLAGDGTGADSILSDGRVDAVVLDLMLPGEDGLSICRRLRASSQVPILMLTALASEVDRIVGLELGADDYLTKPFNSRELVLRVRNLLRRSLQDAPGAERPVGSVGAGRAYEFAGWRVEPAGRRVHSPDGVRVAMTSAEFDVLLALCANPGRVLSRQQLMEATHVGAAGPTARSVDVHISRLRQKLEPDPRDPVLIKTVRLGGYVLAAPVVSRADVVAPE